MRMYQCGDIHVGDAVYHVNPVRHAHGNRTSDQTKGVVVRIINRAWGPSLIIKHDGRNTPLEWNPSLWRKQP